MHCCMAMRPWGLLLDFRSPNGESPVDWFMSALHWFMGAESLSLAPLLKSTTEIWSLWCCQCQDLSLSCHAYSQDCCGTQLDNPSVWPVFLWVLCFELGHLCWLDTDVLEALMRQGARKNPEFQSRLRVMDIDEGRRLGREQPGCPWYHGDSSPKSFQETLRLHRETVFQSLVILSCLFWAFFVFLLRISN